MPVNLNTGVISLSAETDGGASLIRVEVYYNPAAAEPRPIRDVSGLIENGQTRGRALRVWNTSPAKRTEVTVTDFTTGDTVTVAIQGGGDLTRPVVTRTAAQLAAWGITAQDQARSLTLTVYG